MDPGLNMARLVQCHAFVDFAHLQSLVEPSKLDEADENSDSLAKLWDNPAGNV